MTRFYSIKKVVIVCGIMICLWIMTIAVNSQLILHEGMRRGDCVMRLKQISIALWSYQDKYGSLPPSNLKDSSGNALHSWRVLILPFLGGEELYQQYKFSEPWNSPNNSRLQSELAGRYHCPTDRSSILMTNYVAITGPLTMWPDDHSPVVINDAMRAAMPEVLLVEISDSEINWMEPKDMSVDDLISILADDSGKFKPNHSIGTNFADTASRIHVFPKNRDPFLLKKILTKSPPEAHNFD